MFYPECQVRSKRFALLSISIIVVSLFAACTGSTAKFLAKGEEYLKKRKFHDALMQFRSAADSDPSSAAAHWGLCRSYENLGQFNEAFDEIRKTVEIDPNNLDVQAKLGNYFLLVKPAILSEAEKAQEYIESHDPKYVEGTVLKASILAARGRPDTEVISKIDEAIAIDPSRVETYVSLSRYYITREMFDKAEDALKRGIAANPNRAIGPIEYGRFLMYAKRDSEADQQFARAISIDGTDIEAREAQADFFVTSDQLDRAEAAYKGLIEIQENSPESRLELADFYNGVHRPDDAVNVLQDIVSDTPDYARARYALAQIYLDKKDDAGVDAQLTELFKVDKEDQEALMLRARLRMMQGRADDAIKDLEDVLKKQPSLREGLFYMAQAKIASGQIDQANAFIGDLEKYHPDYLRTGLLKIQAAFASNDKALALKVANEVYNKISNAAPNADTGVMALQDLLVRSLSARGVAYLDLNLQHEAQADLEQVLKITPNSSSAMVNLAKVFTAEKNFDRASELYQKAITIDPQNFDAMSGFVNLYLASKRYDQAHALINQLILSNAGRADVLAALHYLNSQVFAAEGNKESTEAELVQAIGLDADYLPAYSAYATILAQKGNAQQAIEQYQKVNEKRPSATAFTMIAILEDSRGNTAAAEKNYRTALEYSPDAPIAANNLAWLIVENQGNLDEALRLASVAVAKDPNVAGYYDTLGWVYLKKSLFSSAAQQFKKAIEIAEKDGKAADPGYRVRLGMALSSAGDKAAAKREAEISLRNASLMTQQETAQAREVLNAH